MENEVKDIIVQLSDLNRSTSELSSIAKEFKKKTETVISDCKKYKESIEKSGESITKAFGEFEEDIAAVKKGLDKATSTIERLSSSVKELEKSDDILDSLNNIIRPLRELTQAVADNSEKINQLHTELDTIGDRFSAIESFVESQDSKLDERLSAAETAIEEKLNEGFAGLEKSLEEKLAEIVDLLLGK